MQIDLPDAVVATANRLAAAGAGANAVDVITRAVEKMNADRMAIQEGIDAYEAGDFRPLEEFGKELKDQYGITLPEA